MLDAPLTRPVACRRYRNGRFSDITDDVATEIRVTLTVAGVGKKTLYAAPLDPEVLVLGHAALDMLPAGQIPVVTAAEGLFFDLDVRPDTRPAPDTALPRGLPAAELLGLMRRFIAEAGLWDDTGCFHRAALYDTGTGEFVVRAEDIGRHNCLDRLAGYGLRLGLCLPELILFLSCRVTASMMHKALRAGIRMVVSRSAVTGAALTAAQEAGITLIGFARDAEERFTVFTDPSGRVGL
ncbi:Formate dehydrogenase chain D [Desulfovibrio sp. DV]|uniref:formate dehydrogenase accessory sulfurtransferase FdhD n=1 Tax=Desulfovibrio sp. DV TaxID=1844708 RepID=UPI00094BAE75|nr:formate dehydrogenase accessory sulfurtransferase FdhD [Desulfovibrio sp. DV]OLN26562.1 Formate dehydrogenase chain D [Desulfovibrio sp. DV]